MTPDGSEVGITVAFEEGPSSAAFLGWVTWECISPVIDETGMISSSICSAGQQQSDKGTNGLCSYGTYGP